MKYIKKFFSCLFDPFSNLFKLDSKTKLNDFITKHNIIVVLLSIIITAAIMLLFIFLL